MIHRTWRDPCWRFSALDLDGRVERGVTWAATEDDLRERLEAMTLTDISIQPYDFADWRRRAREAAEAAREAVGANEPCEFRDAIWRELKLHLFDLFDGKCAYCEGEPDDPSTGQVEHYRPKRRVTGDPNHKGYYWLAYDETNFLPCCARCNGARAKANHFPIEGERAYGPDGIANERPLLLNPLHDDPAQHLAFLNDGKVQGTTPSGERSREVYNLNRPRLVTKRQQSIQKVLTEVFMLSTRTDTATALREMNETLARGVGEWSAARLSAFRQIGQQWGRIAAGP